MTLEIGCIIKNMKTGERGKIVKIEGKIYYYVNIDKNDNPIGEE